MNTPEIIGITGAVIILVLFLLNQMGKLTKESFLYDVGNFIGAALLCWYAWLIDSTPFLILNAVWALFSLKDAIADIKKRS